MTPALFAGLFFHFMLLSLIAIGGFMATLPGMYSYLVDTAGLLTPETFAKTVAFGQSLPGPNVLVAAVLGWAAAGPLGVLGHLRRHIHSLFADCRSCRTIHSRARFLSIC